MSASSSLTIVPQRPTAARLGQAAPLTPIFGRDAEIEQVVRLLDRDDLRVVTLLGPGGVGKTRLAQEITRIAGPDFAHDACFVALASIRQPNLVPKAIAQSLGIQESVDRPAADALVDVLADRHLLLVLDNLEQVIGAAPWLAELLAQCRLLKVLVTSRISLNIAGEQRFVVPPLPVPDTGAEALDRNAAVDLFVQRAQAVDLTFSLAAKNAASVAEICRRLDGLPLAIELAAARVKILSPDAILARLTNRLTLLTGGRRDVPPRLQSMHDAVGWSYDLLAEAEKRLFRRLAVFEGGFTLEAAGFVAAWPQPPMADESVIDAIGGLVDQSLVQAMTGGPRSRFRMLETIREYGLRQIDATGHDDSGRLAHAEYYRNLAERAEPALTGSVQANWLNLLETEHANIRAAMAWLEAHGRLDDAIAVHAQIQFFLNIRGHGVESLKRLDDWLELPDLATRSRSRGLALMGAGGLRQNVGDTERSAAMLVESAGILRDVGDAFHAGMALGNAGATYFQQGDLERLRSTALACLESAQQHGYSRQISASLGHLSKVALMNGDLKLAADLQQQGCQVAIATGDLWLIAFRSAEQAEEDLRSGNVDRAAQHAMEAKNLFSELGSKRDLPSAWEQMSRIAHKQGDLVTAADYAATALSIAETCGYSWSVAWGHLLVGIIAAEQGLLALSIQSLTTALTLLQAKDQPLAIADCLVAFAGLAARAGEAEMATQFLGASAARMHQVGIDQDLWEPDSSSASVVASLRDRLGEERFESLKAEGAALSADEAVAAAMAYTLPDSGMASRPEPVDPVRHYRLSRRELEVLQLMANGLSNQQIADALFLSQRTVTTHVTGIFGKLDLSSRTAAVSFAIRSGIA